jgi:signal transduction histidine kinase
VRELLHDALHELAAINTLASAVEAEGGCTEAGTENLRRIQRQTDALSDMLHEVFLSRLEQGVVNVREVLEEMALSAAGEVRVAVRVPENAPNVVLSDQLRLRRVVRNLVDNAVRAAAPDGVVEISLAATGEELVIAVDDSGPGFGNAPQGLGSLGLQIVTRLVEEGGGGVAVEDSPLGGARVRASFPIVLVVDSGVDLAADDGTVAGA